MPLLRRLEWPSFTSLDSSSPSASFRVDHLPFCELIAGIFATFLVLIRPHIFPRPLASTLRVNGIQSALSLRGFFDGNRFSILLSSSQRLFSV